MSEWEKRNERKEKIMEKSLTFIHLVYFISDFARMEIKSNQLCYYNWNNWNNWNVDESEKKGKYFHQFHLHEFDIIKLKIIKSFILNF